MSPGANFTMNKFLLPVFQAMEIKYGEIDRENGERCLGAPRQFLVSPSIASRLRITHALHSQEFVCPVTWSLARHWMM